LVAVQVQPSLDTLRAFGAVAYARCSMSNCLCRESIFTMNCCASARLARAT